MVDSRWEANMTPEQREEADKEADQERARRVEEFRKTLEERDAEIYLKGIQSATDLQSRRAYNTRSIVLLLVVLAVVMMPVIAIVVGLDPQAFGAYIAPVTAIAGTVVGYWFGTVERGPSK
jgi:hypothetical protein